MPGQPVDQPGQRALAQVDGFGQVLGAELPLLALGQPLEDLGTDNPRVGELTASGVEAGLVPGERGTARESRT